MRKQLHNHEVSRRRRSLPSVSRRRFRRLIVETLEDRRVLNGDGLDFGDVWDETGGDANGNPYPTLLEHNGARHNILPGYQLGASIDPEADGQPNSTATGDDTDGNDDEDGVVFTSLLLVGRTATIDVTASQPMLLNAFLDFGGDGSFAQAGDQIFTNQPLAPGVNKLAFVVPTTVTPGITTFARFRVNSTGGLSYDGFAADGEVEDYQVNISLPLPDRIGVFRLGQNFHLDTTGNGAWDHVTGGDTFGVFGIPSLVGLAKGVVGDWDGNGSDDLGLYNDGLFYLDTTGNGKWDTVQGQPCSPCGDTFRDFGIRAIRSTAKPVIGDWDGNGIDDLGLYDDGNFYLDTTGNGVWDTAAGGDTFHDFGIAGIRRTALPIVGDWNNDGTDDLGLFNERGNFYLDTTLNGMWDHVAGGDTYQFYRCGRDGVPLVGNWGFAATQVETQQFTVTSSNLTVTGRARHDGEGVWRDFSPQGAGSNTPQMTGTINVVLDNLVNPTTIDFVLANLDLTVTGSWSPDVGAVPGTAPANFGLSAPGFFGDFPLDLAGRDLTATLSSANPLAIVANSFDASAVDMCWLDGSYDDYSSLVLGRTVDATGQVLTDGGSAAASFTGSNGNFQMTIPFVKTVSFFDGLHNIELNYAGSITASYSGGSMLEATTGAPAQDQVSPDDVLSPETLLPVVDRAIGVWSAMPLSSQQENLLQDVEVYITDLPGSNLGQALGNTISIDANAAGHGWFVDPTPGANEEFDQQVSQGLLADANGPAADRMDLLTVVLHEMGHVLGHGDLDDILSDDVMNGWLAAGVRRL